MILRVELNSWKKRCVSHAIEGLNGRAYWIVDLCDFLGHFVSEGPQFFQKANIAVVA